jgi:hypothetical protein
MDAVEKSPINDVNAPVDITTASLSASASQLQAQSDQGIRQIVIRQRQLATQSDQIAADLR